jgi:Domain of unknown function (DUF4262)
MCAAEAQGLEPDDVALETLWRIEDNIEKYGHTIQYVQGDSGDPSWAYTIGRMRSGLPELVVTGLDPASSAGVLKVVHDEWQQVVNGMQPSGGGPEIRLMPVPRSVVESTDYLSGAVAYSRRHLVRFPSAQQIIWADPSGSFPWDVSCAARYRRLQPIIAFGNHPIESPAAARNQSRRS